MWEQLIVFGVIKAIELLENRLKKQPQETSKEEALMAEARARVIKYKASMKLKKEAERQ